MIVFGGADVVNSNLLRLGTLDGSNGFVIKGIDSGDYSAEVSDAGDFNGDGLSDVIIGAPGSDPNGIDAAGESYIVFGGAGVGNSGSLDLSLLDGTNGFVINGIDAGDSSGYSVSTAGDFNGGAGSDVLTGSSGNDVINGGLGEDEIFGNGGNDTIIATDVTSSGGNSDLVNGGAGVDNCLVDDIDRVLECP